MNNVNRSHIVFMIVYTVMITLLNFKELHHWMSQFLMLLWVLIIGLLIPVTGYIIRRLFHKANTARLLSTYFFNFLSVVFIFAAISHRTESFMEKVMFILTDNELFLKLNLPYVSASLIASILFYYQQKAFRLGRIHNTTF